MSWHGQAKNRTCMHVCMRAQMLASVRTQIVIKRVPVEGSFSLDVPYMLLATHNV